MKKKYSLLLITLFLLTSCGEGNKPVDPSTPTEPSTPSEPTSSTWVDPDTDYPLTYDGYDAYPIDSSISNENGSMSYELFVRTFYDTNGDGIGDINGVKAKIPYLASLGIKTVWMMPIHNSPSYHGYDVTDYYSVHPDYGTLSDFDALITEANKYHIDIMLDMVLNHTATNNPYFHKSYVDYKNDYQGSDSKKDWYVWRDDSASNYYQYMNDRYYLGMFGYSMPDLNLNSEGVRNEIDNICKFWIKEHGVKGFRLDAAMHYMESNIDSNNEFLGWLKSTTQKYDPNFYMVAEVWTNDVTVNSYYKSGLDSFFRFDNSVTGDYNFINLTKGYGNIDLIAKTIQNNEATMKKNNPTGYSSYFVSNHDQDRPSYDKTELGLQQNKSLVNLYALLPGTPFMYYGEEIQMVGKRNTSPDDLSDARRRLPMIWSKDNKTGQTKFPEQSRKDLDNTVQVELGVEDQLADPFSLLNHYRYVINVRNKYPSLFKYGVFTSLNKQLSFSEDYMEGRVMAYKLSYNGESIIIIHNFSMYNAEIEALGSEIIESLTSTHKAPSLKDGLLRIGAYSSVILKA